MKLNNATPAAPAAQPFDVKRWADQTIAKIEGRDYARKLREKNKRDARKKKSCNQLNLF